MMYKDIEPEYLILCSDRLTRFKFTYDKYYRVFSDIINKYYSGEKKNLSFDETISVASYIFNSSVKKYSPCGLNNDFINELIVNEEKKYFYQNEDSEKLLNSKLNFSGLISLIKDNEDLPLNLKWLVYASLNKDVKTNALREKFSLKFPLNKIVLSEGATEEILLGEFAKYCGYDFDKNGIELVGAGGKNQVARKYYKMIEEVKLPIFILLDKDAAETKELILPKLRDIDKIYLIEAGEFEDIIPREVVIGSINSSYRDNLHISDDDFSAVLNTSKNLKEIYRIKGFGNFNKAEFAKSVKEYLKTNYKISDEMSKIIEMIKNF